MEPFEQQLPAEQISATGQQPAPEAAADVTSGAPTESAEAAVTPPAPINKTPRKRTKTVKVSEETPVAADEDLEEAELPDDTAELAAYVEFSREQLVLAMAELMNHDDINQIKTRVAAIRVEYTKKQQVYHVERLEKLSAEGSLKADAVQAADPVEEEFLKLVGVYKKKRTRYLEQQELLKQENYKAKVQVLDQIKSLIESEETLKKTYDDFKNLQNRWKEIGAVPRNEINNLWQQYHFLVERFLDKVKINKELKDLDLKKNLESKIELCEKVEELLLEKSVMKSFKELQKLHDAWKEIGPAPEDKSNEVWERFKTATDKIHERRRTFYEDQQKERENNLIAKNAICEKAENLIALEQKTQKEWKKATDEIQELQKMWRTIGFAPEKQNNEVWKRFRAAINTFFENKKEYFDKVVGELTNNYNLKLNICTQAEALKDSQDWNRTSRELITLQKEWKEVGPVVHKYSDELWKRFRVACDHFFQSKENYFNNIDSIEQENLQKKLDLIQKVESYQPGENSKESIEQLKEFQREWIAVGHVPIKEKEKLQDDFKAAINKQFDKLQVGSAGSGLFEYQTRMDVVKEMPDALHQIGKEKLFVQKIAQKIQGDINLWENNLGFLGRSKNADVVRQEFQKKIDRAKEDLHQQEQKIKYLSKLERELSKKEK